MATSGLIRDQWIQIRDTQISRFLQLNCDSIRFVFDEDSFRTFFRQKCKEHGETEEIMLYNGLQNNTAAGNLQVLHEQLMTVESQNALEGPRLQLWGGWAAIIESFFKHPQGSDLTSLKDAVDTISEIAQAIPNIENLPLGWEQLDLGHAILKEIYRVSMETCLYVVLCSQNDDGDLFPSIRLSSENISRHEYVRGSANVMAIAKTIHEHDIHHISMGYREVDLTSQVYPAILDYTSQNAKDQRARWILRRECRDGNGGFGSVCVMSESSSKKDFVCKTITFIPRSSILLETTRRLKHERAVKNEVDIMQKLRQHTHITTIFFYAKDYPTGNDRETPCLRIFMLPIAEGNLNHYLEDVERRRFPRAETTRLLKWAGCLMHALAFAHNRSVRHKDIKPANILYKSDQIFLTDFGLSVDFEDAGLSYTTNGFAGTKMYRAPESREGEPHGRKADIFSMGCVFSEMLTVILQKSLTDYREARRHDWHDNAFCRNLSDVEWWFTSLRANCKDEDTRTLLEVTTKMLQEKQEDRPDANSVLEILDQRKGLKCSCV